MVLLQQGPDALVMKHMRARPVVSASTGQTHAMNSDWHTVTENRQMQQSVTLVFLLRLGVSVLLGVSPPSALSWRSAFVLPSAGPRCDLLELVGAPLPVPPQLDAHLDAPKHVLLPALIVDAELEYIAVVDLCGA